MLYQMFQKLNNLFQEYFGLSKKEARGALVLMFFCLLLLWTPFVFRRWISPALPFKRELIDMKKLDSIAVILEKQHQSKFKSYKPYPKKEYTKKLPKPIRLFDFDPNSASVNDLETLGIPPFLAKRIEKFRSKGGKFRKNEDLLNIYDFPSDLFHKLEKHIVIASVSSPSKSPNPHSLHTALPGVSTPGPVFKKVDFDVNVADTVQLVGLKGIGSKISMRIIKFRDALGGFHSENQYAEIFGLDSVALAELHRYAKINSPVKKINMNTANAEELGKHPYLRDKRINATIVNYRNQHGAFQTIDDLRKVMVLNEDLIKKISPYLSF